MIAGARLEIPMSDSIAMGSVPIPVPKETPMEDPERKKKRSTVRGLAEEAKNRMMLLLICAFILAYLMSCTSSSLWANLPVAVLLIICLRYLSLGHGIQKDSGAIDRQASVDKLVAHENSRKKCIKLPEVFSKNSNWRRKVNCPVVEEAIEHFTRHLIAEWVTDLWYSHITPDKDGPEELVEIVNDALGEISSRARDVNLINLLTRDVVNLLRRHLELYRQTKSKIEQQQQELANLPVEHRDAQLKMALEAESMLHPGLFSGEAEHKVLQHLMAGLISFTFKPEDLQCSFFQYTARELLACAVMRPILNLINPRIINEKIEILVRSFTNKTAKGITGTPSGNPSEPSRLTASQLAGFQDRSAVGVELVQVKQDSVNRNSDEPSRSNTIGNPLSEHQIHSYPHLIADFEKDNSQKIAVHKSGGEWAYNLDVISRRKAQSLSPEHLDNMWVKGRDYKNKESAKFPTRKIVHNSPVGVLDVLETKTVNSGFKIEKPNVHSNGNFPSYTTPKNQDISHELDQEGVDTESSYSSDSDENNNVMGLDSPGTKVWDSKTKTKVSRIRHPLESSDAKLMKKSGKSRVFNSKMPRAKRRHRLSNQKLPMWQEVESSYLKDVTDIISTPKENVSNEELSDNSEFERWVRTYSRSATCSSLPRVPEISHCSTRSSKGFMLDDSFLKLRCEVVGANIVKCGSGTFTVYSIAVTDADNNSWSIKRRFRHFEELHRLMKDFPEYNLSLPPKYFLSSGLDATIVQERCILLDEYLKKLLQLPTASRSIEVWDFLSVDSQTYMFLDSLSIIQTLPVVHGDKLNTQNNIHAMGDHLLQTGDYLAYTKKQSPNNSNLIPESSELTKRNIDQHLSNASTRNVDVQHDTLVTNLGKHIFPISGIPERPVRVPIGESVIPQEKPNSIIEPVADKAINTEGVQLNKNVANLSSPILDLVDVIFQLQDGGWIRRQAFWVAKQVLQLGMGDAFDDWLIEKIQLLRRGSFVASMIQHIEQILWPDGIFITKHPNRRHLTPQSSPKDEGNSKSNRMEDQLTYEQVEISRCAEFVHDLIIDKAPVALVGLVGRKEYERCAEDIYSFLQSPVCLKHLAFELLELLLLSIYPELNDIVRHYHEEKEHFGKLEEQ